MKNSDLVRPLRKRARDGVVQREQEAVTDFCASIGIKFLNKSVMLNLASESRGKAFYILGNGSSVNSLTQSDFKHIAEGVSVGTNAWPLHPFVPDIYSFEFSKHSLSPDPELAFMVKRAEANLQEKTSSIMVFLRPGLPAGLKAMVPLAVKGRERVFLYGRANFLSTKPDALSKDIEGVLRDTHPGGLDCLVLPDNGASVIRMIFLALIAGFREIVLLGVDLNDNPYFWYDQRFKSSFGDYTGVAKRDPGDATLTEATNDRPFSTSSFIVTLANVASTALGATISVGSRESALAADLSFRPFACE